MTAPDSADDSGAGAPDQSEHSDNWIVRKIELPPGLSWDIVIEACEAIEDWDESEDENPVNLAVRLYQLYMRGQGDK